MGAHLFGWHESPAEVERVVATMERPIFGLCATPELLDDAPRSVFFWEAEEFLFGRALGAHDQGIGDCVGQGYGRGVQDLLFGQLFFAQKAGEKTTERPARVCVEGVYAYSRVEVGQRRLGRGDGSVGAWAAKAVQFGNLPAQKFDKYDLTEYSAARSKEWGYSGMPDELEPVAKLSPVKTASMVTSVDAARVAIQNWFPIPVCSGQGFVRTRGRGTGICAPSGTWQHCMETRGFLILKGGRWVFVLQQSWGNDPTGPNEVELEDGRTIWLPEGAFCVEADVYGRMLSRWSDSFALSGGVGFVRRDRPDHRHLLANAA